MVARLPGNIWVFSLPAGPIVPSAVQNNKDYTEGVHIGCSFIYREG